MLCLVFTVTGVFVRAMHCDKGVVVVVFRIQKVLSQIVRFPKAALWAIKRRIHPPALPVNEDGGIYIHLGCGKVNSPAFINVDMLKAPHIHYIRDVNDLSCFSSNYASLIYASHVLEHLSHRDVLKALDEWRRVLKPGGVLRLSVPDFDKILEIYEASCRNIEIVVGPIMGTAGEKYNIHSSIFNKASLTKALRRVGFTESHEWNPSTVDHHDFDDWAGQCKVINGNSYPISLNIEAVK